MVESRKSLDNRYKFFSILPEDNNLPKLHEIILKNANRLNGDWKKSENPSQILLNRLRILLHPFKMINQAYTEEKKKEKN